MKKQILNIGKALNKAEQTNITGGNGNWIGFCFPSEGKCNFYCCGTCTPCGAPGANGGFTQHECGF